MFIRIVMIMTVAKVIINPAVVGNTVLYNSDIISAFQVLWGRGPRSIDLCDQADTPKPPVVWVVLSGLQ